MNTYVHTFTHTQMYLKDREEMPISFHILSTWQRQNCLLAWIPKFVTVQKIFLNWKFLNSSLCNSTCLGWCCLGNITFRLIPYEILTIKERTFTKIMIRNIGKCLCHVIVRKSMLHIVHFQFRNNKKCTHQNVNTDNFWMVRFQGLLFFPMPLFFQVYFTRSTFHLYVNKCILHTPSTLSLNSKGCHVSF